MRLVFAGSPAPALPALDALLASRHDVVAVVTQPDRRAGRGRRLTPSPVAARAADAGVPVLRPERVGDDAFVDELRALAPDCCPVVAYGALLPQRVLDVPAQGWVNLHFSVLPAWRGAAPVQHAVRAGDDVTGATVFRIVRELDAGPVYGTLTEKVGARDTSGDLLGRLAESGARLLVAVLDALADGTATPVPQPADGVTYAPKIATADARVDWRQPVLAVDRLVRAMTPAPGAWTPFRDGRLKLAPVEPVDAHPSLDPGEVRVDRDGVYVGTATTPVRLTMVQPPGRTMTDAAAWARGARDLDGERL